MEESELSKLILATDNLLLINVLWMTLFGPSEVRALPVRRCRRAALQTLVATLMALFSLLLLSGSVTFLPEGVDLGS